MQPFGLPRWHYGKELATAGEVRDVGSHPGSGRFPGGHGNPLQDSCLENAMDRGAWRATVHGVAKSRTRLSDLAQSDNLSISNDATHTHTYKGKKRLIKAKT